MLELQGVATYYGKIPALREISLQVGRGEIVALIGANGAGKTTTLRTISGLLHPRAGRIVFKGQDITRWPPDRIVRGGIAHCPEGRQIFAEMTVQENLEMGAYTRGGGIAPALARVFALFPVLQERRGQRAGSLSGGEQQMLAIGRALMSAPELVLFDEPSLGLAPVLVREVARSIRELNRAGTTVLLVEQNAQLAFTVAHRGYVLENGRIALEGAIAALAGDERVRRAYLGG
ncbi:MAG: ABC transporter ATP-binding protein [Armatimonadota bacterium]|nr:ABC transporter ATP-binding protein [Armatimonadota bacterium]MDR7452126.1 ABC transporter ATP-binding protein [Armatimonadota bacterium]MDR7467850.1 ABC transporter ATP-binding protein [Armatimonadota bacterium]MDR7494738.1 ABC transporter ATP-binding protein [Armatimonadota bacterium]MDR7499563.1 ABC transporter ATP-binding protein [Armatimonadota bacterium]